MLLRLDDVLVGPPPRRHHTASHPMMNHLLQPHPYHHHHQQQHQQQQQQQQQQQSPFDRHGGGGAVGTAMEQEVVPGGGAVSSSSVSSSRRSNVGAATIVAAKLVAAAPNSGPRPPPQPQPQPQLARKRRYCLFPGCLRAVKSQGHCQRHGAVAKRCKVLGCDRQAQGKHDGMCKRHYKETQKPPPQAPREPPLEGTNGASANGNEDGDSAPKKVRNVISVYERVLPDSINWAPLRSRPNPAAAKVASTTAPSAAAAANTGKKKTDGSNRATATAVPGEEPSMVPAGDAVVSAAGTRNDNNNHDGNGGDDHAAWRAHDVMPLISHLRRGRKKVCGWHRRDERIAASANPVAVKSQFEPWERRLALVEILLLSGGTPGADFRDLAHAWGREKGFHHHLSATMCERRGDVERKVRSDRGKDKKRSLLAASATATAAAGSDPLLSAAAQEGGNGGDDDGVYDDDDDDDPARPRPAKRPNHRPDDGFQDLLAGDALGEAVL